MLLSTFAASSVWSLVRRIGAFAFIPIGIVDNSLLPTFGGMDAILIVMAASNREFWWYYAIAAVVGAVTGAYFTYRLAAKGGKEMLEKKIGERNANKAYGAFEKWGFWSIILAALAPPPFPSAPVLATAGAMQYPRQNFLVAVSLGRTVRYGLLAWVASRYGRHFFSFFSRYYKPALWTLLALALVGGIVFAFWFRNHRRTHPKESSRKQPAEPKVA